MPSSSSDPVSPIRASRGHPGDPGADERETLAAEEQTEVARPERAQDAAWGVGGAARSDRPNSGRLVRHAAISLGRARRRAGSAPSARRSPHAVVRLDRPGDHVVDQPAGVWIQRKLGVTIRCADHLLDLDDHALRRIAAPFEILDENRDRSDSFPTAGVTAPAFSRRMC